LFVERVVTLGTELEVSVAYTETQAG
jgi:hypothetical protein